MRPIPAASDERSPAPARAAPRFEVGARRRSDAGAALLLAALWVGLWAVFSAGVVLPAAAVHASRERHVPPEVGPGVEVPGSSSGHVGPEVGVAGAAR